MEIRIRDTGEVISEFEFRLRYSSVSLPENLNTQLLDSVGSDVVLEGPQPIYTKSQFVARDGVYFEDGNWYTKYIVLEKDPDTIAIELQKEGDSVRGARNVKLAACDWTQLADANVNKEAWTAYRQALRDITSQPGFPSDVIWPDEPSV